MASSVPGFSSDDLEAAAKLLSISESSARNDWQKCVWIVEAAISQQGDYDVITANMESAQAVLQTLTDEYDDYTYYPKLKEYYAAVSSYVNFFTNPTGSFNQLSDTVNDFENAIRTLESDIAFLFTK